MPRRVEDIIRSDRRTVRDIPRPEKPADKPHRKEQVSDSEAESVPIRRNTTAPLHVTPPPPKEPPRARRPRASRASKARKIGVGVFLAVILLVAGTAYVASTYFSHATFTIVPVTLPVTATNTTIVVTATTTPGYLRYEVVRYTGSASTTLPAIDGTVVSTKATGTVTLFNSYAKDGQRLIAGTRFAGENGQIYRLSSSVFIPGYTSSGVGTSPGTIRATLVADAAGSQYNMARNDGGSVLHIVAYQGSPRYDTVYAKAYTGMTGGFAGTKKIVNPQVLASTTADVQAALTRSLAAQALAHVPEGYVTYPTAYGTSFAPTDVSGSDPKKAVVTVSGTLYSIVFKQRELAAKLAGPDNMSRFGSAQYSITGLESLNFTITNPSTFRATKLNTLIARLSGSITLTGVVPTDEIRHKLAGMPLADTRQVFASYGSVIDISRSSGELFPSWASAVPKDESRISVVVKKP